MSTLLLFGQLCIKSCIFQRKVFALNQSLQGSNRMVFVFYIAVFKEAGGGVFKCIKLSYKMRVSLFVLVLLLVIVVGSEQLLRQRWQGSLHTQ